MDGTESEDDAAVDEKAKELLGKISKHIDCETSISELYTKQANRLGLHI